MPYATNNGVRIRYEVEGDGPPLLLHIGGVGGALEDWHDAGYVSALRDDYRLILLDPRGQGRSDAPHDDAAYTYDQRIGDVCAVLDAAGVERVHYWGYSMGGQIGYRLAATRPDRLLSLVAGGANPYAPPIPPEEFYLYRLLQLGMDDMVAELEADDPEFWASDGERARWLATDAAALSAAIRAALGSPALDDDTLASIHVPALVYSGTDDNPGPRERAARAMPNATFAPLDGLNHATAINRSDAILPHVTAFLARVRQASGNEP